MAAGPTRWGIIGAGAISHDFCLALRTLPTDEHQLVAVAARDLSSAEQFAAKHQVVRAYNSYATLAGDPDVDIVYIGTVNSNHVELSLMSLTAGKHVLCEKPMSLSRDDARKVIELARQKKLLYVEGVWSRFFPAYRQLRQELSSGSIGDVRGLMVSFGVTFNWEQNERLYRRELGGGVTKDIGCYTTQLACLVFNNEQPEHIYTHGLLHSTGVDRVGHVMLAYSGGRVAQCSVTGESRLPNTAIVYGTKGRLELAAPFWCSTSLTTPTQTHTFSLPETAQPTKFSNSAGFVYEIRAVRQALCQGKLELEEISHADSLVIAGIQDTVLAQLGVQYNCH